MEHLTESECRETCQLYCDRVSNNLYECVTFFESRRLCYDLIIGAIVATILLCLVDLLVVLCRKSTVVAPFWNKSVPEKRQNKYIQEVREREVQYLKSRLLDQ